MYKDIYPPIAQHKICIKVQKYKPFYHYTQNIAYQLVNLTYYYKKFNLKFVYNKNIHSFEIKFVLKIE